MEKTIKNQVKKLKKIMLEKIDDGDTILLFPEGKPTKKGILTVKIIITNHHKI
jgi:hypothetical protein